MTDYPPKLVQVVENEFGSTLCLSNGRSVLIDIRPERLDRALREFGRPSLGELVASRSLGVFTDTRETQERDWERISQILRASPVAIEKFRDFPSIWEVLNQSAAFVRELPQRVYGGLDQALYTSHRFQFQEDPNRPSPWRYALLNAPGGWLFKTWVHLALGQVDIVDAVLLGHFIE